MFNRFNKISSSEKEKLKYIFLFFLVLVVSVLVEPFEKGRFEICIFKNLTNLPCPGCGFTRSFIYLAHGDVWNSIRMNPFGLIVFGFWTWVTIKDLAWIIWRKSFPFLPESIWSKSKTGFIVALLVFGVIRMALHFDEFQPMPIFKNLLAIL
ncbi:DUF2752 domain-containing protein [bacterium]|nr:DUF2752 domain-containing protein [bacterium]